MTDAQPPSPDLNSIFGSLDLDSEFWQFSLSFYSRPGVAPACLILQNQRGVDVNILLLAIFAAVQHDRVLTTADLQAANDIVRAWRAEIIENLRKLRTRLKIGPAPAPSTATEDLRRDIKAAELKAERIEQALLMRFLDELLPVSASETFDAKSLIERVIQQLSDTPANAPPALEINQATDVLTSAVIGAKASN